jgi:hypothetical protein
MSIANTQPPVEGRDSYLHKRPGLVVLFSGVATSALTRALLYVLDELDWHVQGTSLGAQAIALAQAGHAEALAALLAEHARSGRATRRHPLRVELVAESCPRCRRGRMVSRQRCFDGRASQSTELASAPIDAKVLLALGVRHG